MYDISEPKVMGILNVTPDSFYDGGRHFDTSDALKQVEMMVDAGADMVDVGGYSSRPGAENVSAQEESNRAIPIISAISKEHPALPISVDTFRSEVAIEALESGASLVNDISGGNLDPKMYELISSRNVPYILMHMRGTPQTMAKETDYQKVVLEVVEDLQDKVNKLRDLGVNDIIVDPGFGFAKTVEQNYEILKNLEYFKVLNLPLLVGLSRKSMVYKTLDITPEQALNGSTVLNTIALMKGANILRVHDVKEAKEAVKLFSEVA